MAQQNKDCDVFKAHEMAQHLKKVLINERSQDKFSTLLSEIKRKTSTLNMQPAKKRMLATQRNQANPSVEDRESHYRVAYFFAFHDHPQNHLNRIFPADL